MSEELKAIIRRFAERYGTRGTLMPSKNLLLPTMSAIRVIIGRGDAISRVLRGRDNRLPRSVPPFPMSTSRRTTSWLMATRW
jgi:hypothetical protein